MSEPLTDEQLQVIRLYFIVGSRIISEQVDTLLREVERLKEELASSQRALEISRNQTKDAFERVANAHNENVSLKEENARLENVEESVFSLTAEITAMRYALRKIFASHFTGRTLIDAIEEAMKVESAIAQEGKK